MFTANVKKVFIIMIIIIIHGGPNRAVLLHDVNEICRVDMYCYLKLGFYAGTL